MKYYLCGPIDTAGKKDVNVQAFINAAFILRHNHGFDIVSPVELGTEGNTYEWFLRRDIKALMDCGAIILLEGWPQSKGARAELMIAMNLNMKVYYYATEELKYIVDMNFS